MPRDVVRVSLGAAVRLLEVDVAEVHIRHLVVAVAAQ